MPWLPRGVGAFIKRLPMQTIFLVEKTISEETIVSLYGTPFKLVNAPPVGYVIVPLFLTIASHITGHDPYTAGGTLFLKIGSEIAACNIDPSVLTGTDDALSLTVEFGLSSVPLASIRHQPIYLTNDTQAFSDGTDSSMDIVLIYELIKLTS